MHDTDFVINENLLNPYAAFSAQETEDPTKAPSYLLTLSKPYIHVARKRFELTLYYYSLLVKAFRPRV